MESTDQIQSEAVNRKRLLPLMGYDEDSNSKFIFKHDYNSVSLFQGLLSDSTANNELKSNKRRKEDDAEQDFFYFDDETANDGISSIKNSASTSIDKEKHVNDISVLKEITLGNNGEKNEGLSYWYIKKYKIFILRFFF